METREEVIVKVDISKYKYVDLDVDAAERFIRELSSVLNVFTNDMKEVIRYLKNFDEFYEYARKKFKDYLALPHRPADYVKGTAIVDKVKLYRNEAGEKRITIVFDRRVPINALTEALQRLGFQPRIIKEF